MPILKWGGLGLLGLFVLLIALNWTKIQRLLTVNSLFDADKIVENFSSMDAAFLHHDLTIGDAAPWEEDLQDLPRTVMLAGEETSLSEALEELDTTALVIIRDGKLIHESYYKDTERDDLRISWSVAKSFMSGLYGQAIEDGLMDIEQPIETYLPQLTGTAYEGATVANILNMASGVKFNEDYLDPKSDINDMGRVLGLGGSMDKYTETLVERESEPGTVWQYVSIDTHVAAMALRKATGKTLHQLWEESYGEHLGMGKSPFYLTDGEDVAFALGGLNLRTRDYAKFGQLFLQGGEWEGEQLIPAEWVNASTVNLAPNVHPVRGSGYGYQWWVPMPQEGPSKGDYFAVGIYGQYVYVNPAMNIVIAKNAADREFTFEQSNGQHSMNMNIDIFRSLAEQLKFRGVKSDYFPDYHVQGLENDWYSGMLSGLDEPSLKADGYSSDVTLRLLHLPTFNHPTSVRYSKIGNEIRRISVTSDGFGGYQVGKISERLVENVSSDEFEEILRKFSALEICEKAPPASLGMDGTTWVFEYKDKSQHCVLDVWQSGIGEPYLSVGETMLGDDANFGKKK